ncbi:MAG: CDP-paratose 2-epimerase, partial [Candidatus Marinimicrobia bacterium]|nr:CDP-paratose 2-epimerase [Candidatus Neomarinimicrobiota bacterium]
DQGWIGWFINEFLKFKDDNSYSIQILGNGKQVRDILYIDDLTNLFYKILDTDFKTLQKTVFNVGGGLENSFSIIELLTFLKEYFNLDYEFNFDNKNWRSSDQKFYVSDLGLVSNTFDWEPKSNLNEKLIEYLNWIEIN